MVRTQSPTRRQHILDVAAAVFSRKGYHSATVADIITGAGIARGTFYLYFKSKKEVFEVLLDDFLTQLKQGIEVIDVASSVSPLDQLQENLARVMAAVRENNYTASLVLGGVGAPDPQVRDKVVNFFDEVKALIRSSIQTGKGLGLVRDVPDELAVHFVFGAAREVASEVVAQEDESHSGPPLVDARVLPAELVRLVARGLLTRKAVEVIGL